MPAEQAKSGSTASSAQLVVAVGVAQQLASSWPVVEAAAEVTKVPDAQAKSGCISPLLSSVLLAQVAVPQQTASVRPA